jgi:hypothetical protein
LRDSSLLCFNNVWPAKAVDAQAVADAIATPRNTSSTTHERLGEQRQREEASGNKDAEEGRRRLQGEEGVVQVAVFIQDRPRDRSDDGNPSPPMAYNAKRI